MEYQEAVNWLECLADKVENGVISKFQAYNEVFEEVNEGEHDMETEDLYFEFIASECSHKAMGGE